MIRTVTRYHDISAGHRVHGHESKCAHLHGHNYRIHFTVAAEDFGVDSLGRVIDFAAVKERLCMWVETHWDHKFLMWQRDPLYLTLKKHDPDGVVGVPFNPTAEAMAEHLVQHVGPAVLPPTLKLVQASIEETAKCSATVGLEGWHL